jgi:hypothetical protein
MSTLIVPNGCSVSGSHFSRPTTSSSSFARFDPSDFWLFRYLKGVLQGNSFDESDELFSTIQNMLRRVVRETLDLVFQE